MLPDLVTHDLQAAMLHIGLGAPLRAKSGFSA